MDRCVDDFVKLWRNSQVEAATSARHQAERRLNKRKRAIDRTVSFLSETTPAPRGAARGALTRWVARRRGHGRESLLEAKRELRSASNLSTTKWYALRVR